MADNLLDKASILLTPTAYNDGSMLSVKPENGDGDFTFSRSSAATRVNAQGLVENVQIISSELVSNGNFSQIGTEEVSNGNFSQEGSELVTNGDFATDSDWSKDTSWTIENGAANYDGLNSVNDLQQTNVLIGNSGTSYVIRFEVKSGTLRLLFAEGAIGLNSYANYGVGTHTIYVKKTTSSTELRIYAQNTDGGTSGSIDNVSVKEVGQDWTLQNGSTISVGEANVISGADNIGNGRTNHSLYQDNIFTIGKSYIVTFDAKQTVGSGYFQVGQGTAASSSILLTNSFVTYTWEFTAIANTYADSLVFGGRTQSDEFVITNISVKEVGQNWTFGTGWSVDQANSKATFDGGADSAIQQSSVLTNGLKYKLTINVSDRTTGSLQVRFGNTGLVDKTINDNGDFNYVLTSDGTSLYFRSVAGFDGSITNISVKEITDDTDLPRIDYTDGCGSWLLEPQSTNLITYSEDFSDSSWTNINSSKASGFLAPNGQNDAFRFLTTNGASSYLFASNISVSNSTEYTISCYVKSNDNGLDDFKFYTSAGFSSVITAANEWQRFEFTITTNSTSIDLGFNGQDTNTDILIWGAQLEQQSYATSYIPTNGATNTRLQDIATNSGNSTLINSTEGVLYAEIAALANDGTDRKITLSDSSLNNVIIFGYSRFSGNINAEVISGGVLQTSGFGATGVTQENNNKFALSWGGGTFKFYLNGILASSYTNVTSPIGMNVLNFSKLSGFEKMYAKTKCLAVWKEALSDEELIALTSN